MNMGIYPWLKAPFIRLLTALITGILLQWRFHFAQGLLLLLLMVALIAVLFYILLSLRLKYRFSPGIGLAIHFVLAITGALLLHRQDIQNNSYWFARYSNKGSYFLATIEEPLVEKPNSFKALTTINAVFNEGSRHLTEGKILVYFKRDSSIHLLHYGSQIIFQKPLQEIRNSGNPGSFDIRQYNHFQGITHQVFLNGTEFILLPTVEKNILTRFIFDCRDWVVHTVRKYIHGAKETGLAEALLIGYKDDLDKNLIQSYSNTGVVHIIAISGLHLGLIYELLLLVTRPLKRKNFILLRLLLILSSLWLFSILAGGQPSVLRSAVMFSFIAAGEVIGRRTNIYNNLALSAFVLLCINPFWLWDVGFQLSYSAVTSIVLFFKPVYNWFYVPNKWLDFIWKLNAVTISAQLLTLPFTMYHFHQLPTLFLFTNLVAVPLSSIILIGEIALCSLFFLPLLAKPIGFLLTLLIGWMNSYIELLEKIPFSLWQGIFISTTQAVLLTVFIFLVCFWLMENKKSLLSPALIFLFCFVLIRTESFLQATKQKRIIVYNTPKHQAIDLIAGRDFCFVGDKILLSDPLLYRFYLQSARVQQRMFQEQSRDIKQFRFFTRQICIIDSTEKFIPLSSTLDLLVFSGNPRVRISDLQKKFLIRQVIIDASVNFWKAERYKKECDSLHIPCYDISEKGAFVMNL